ncbi:hypothetical protein HMPREF9123_1678 [Neisseria bacilliformis ATCC BAA-1200]|uniref:Uncharacterized protein n=1 Tax=Neisseria bacilliformis ATCC BAA-1200 TaxID=888742 RepID=F2BD72_9NEIS|nr:hypothetical protein HMPREF9123_1678 [Neisseria bacilliformis ATCC BAA-1200]
MAAPHTLPNGRGRLKTRFQTAFYMPFPALRKRFAIINLH